MEFIDAKRIMKLISMDEMIKTIEDYYINNGEKYSLVPDRLFINDSDNTAILMPSFYKGYFATKVIGIAPQNTTIGEPTLRGMIILFDREKMEPLIIIDARTVTSIRTGAISGLGMKYMASHDASKLGIIGTGDQGWSHLLAACSVRPIKEVLINNRSLERAKIFIDKVKREFPNIEVRETSKNEILQLSDIVITTSTSEAPVLPYIEGIDLTGKHFAASGAFKENMQEVPDYIIRRADHISVDSYAAFSECGEMKTAKSIGYSEENIMDIQKLVLNREVESIQKGVTIFKSVGVAILDTLASKLIFEKINKYTE